MAGFERERHFAVAVFYSSCKRNLSWKERFTTAVKFRFQPIDEYNQIETMRFRRKTACVQLLCECQH